MAKIGNITAYPEKTTPVGADTVIGTDSEDGDNTKQFPISGIAGLANLQSVLDSGNTATQSINLTGTAAVTTVTSTTITNTGQVETDDLYVTGQLFDATNNPGSANEVLTSTGTATDWTDSLTLNNVTVNGNLVAGNVGTLTSAPVTFVKMNNLGVSSATVIVAPGAGNYIEVLSATFRMTYNTTAYGFSTDLTLGTTAADQFILPFGSVNASGNSVASFIPATGATAGVLGENLPLILGTASNPAPAGDSNVTIDIIYRIITA